MHSTEILQAMFDALAARDHDAWEAIVAPDAVLHVPFTPAGVPPRLDGRAAFESLTWDFFRSWDSFEWKDIELHATQDDPDLVFGTGRSQASNASRSYSNDYVFKARTRDGKVVEYFEYLNPLNVI